MPRKQRETPLELEVRKRNFAGFAAFMWILY